MPSTIIEFWPKFFNNFILFVPSKKEKKATNIKMNDKVRMFDVKLLIAKGTANGLLKKI